MRHSLLSKVLWVGFLVVLSIGPSRAMTKAEIINEIVEANIGVDETKAKSVIDFFFKKTTTTQKKRGDGNMLRFSNFTISSRRIDNISNRILLKKPKEIVVVGSKVSREAVHGSGELDDDCNLQVTIEIGVSEHADHPDFLWNPRPIEAAMKALASIKKRVEMNQKCPRGDFVLKRIVDLQLFLPKSGDVASVLLSPEIDDEVLVMSFDLPVSVLFQQDGTVDETHDFDENFGAFSFFLPNLSSARVDDDCFNRVAAAKLGLFDVDLACDSLRSCSDTFIYWLKTDFDLTVNQAQIIVDILLRSLPMVVNRESMAIMGIGVLLLSRLRARTVINPKTGTHTSIPARNIVKFKADW